MQDQTFKNLGGYTNKPLITSKENTQSIGKISKLVDSAETNIGIKLTFPINEESYQKELAENGHPTTIDFDTNSYTSGFMGTIQNCLVNTLVELGSDTNHPERGTELEQDAINGYITNTTNLVHSCNFASERVKNFQNNYLGTNYITNYIREKTSDSDQTNILIEDQSTLVSPTIYAYRLAPQVYNLDSVKLQAQFESSEGEVVGLSVDTSLLNGIISQ